MTTRPFHHGNLRAVLLEQAQTMLRETGIDGLSLRELARQAGVSHGAPRSHFIDRQALLDAVAEEGFARLADNVRAAIGRSNSLDERFERVGLAYVDFAVDDAALMDLMFATKTSAAARPVQEAAERLFRVLGNAMGAPSETDVDGTAREQFKLLFVATMQGIATLITSRRIDREQGVPLVREAVEVMLSSQLRARAIGAVG